MPNVTMPQLGEGVEEGTIGKWLKAIGDHVRVGDPLVEVVTDKVNAEVPSPFEGVLTKILVSEGETIPNDAPIAEVEQSGEAAAEPGASSATESEDVEPGAESAATDGAAGADSAKLDAAAGSPQAGASESAAPAAGSAAPVAEAEARAADQTPIEDPAVPTRAPSVATAAPSIPTNVRMTPAVRRLARDLRVDVAAIAGSGIGGRITRADVETAAAGATNGSAPRPSSSSPAPAVAESPVRDGDSLKKLSPMRKAIANHMTRFLDVPAAYITFEVDMSPVVSARTAINAEYKAREGMSLSYVAYVTMACVEALRRHHDFNAHWTDEGHWRRKDINVGIAVAVDDGLVVPVIRNADNLSLHGLNAAINDLAKRARNKKLAPSDLEGGTFTVDNTGWTGSILTLPIINVPEVAIVTMEKIVKRPVVLEEAGDAIAVRSMMNMCIAIDHRAVDGAQAGEFLADVQRWLESVDESTPVW